jgi:hypothetical protein
MQLVIFLPIFNASCMRLKIRCDGWKRKYFGYAWQVNAAIDGHVAGFIFLRPSRKEEGKKLGGRWVYRSARATPWLMWPMGAVVDPSPTKGIKTV